MRKLPRREVQDYYGFFFKQKTAYDILACLEFRRVLFRSLVALDAAARDGDGLGPTLLVCPMSLVGNWQREAERFTPHLRVHVHHGSDRARGEEFEKAVADADLVLTTYAVAARDVEALRDVPWRRVVLDEAQAAKKAERESGG